MKIDIKTKKIIILGVGGIGKCISHYLTKFFIYEPKNLYLIDKIKDIDEDFYYDRLKIQRSEEKNETNQEQES